MEQGTTWFAHEAGERETLAIAMRLFDDPDSDAADREVAATWGELSIWVGGRNVCAHRVPEQEHDAVRWHFRGSVDDRG